MSSRKDIGKLDDSELVKECLNHKVAATTELYNRFERKMFGVCLRYAKNRMEAEDILHEGFIKVLKNLSKYRHEGPLGGWIRRIMVNTALNYFRDNSNYTATIDIDTVHGKADDLPDSTSILSEQELLLLIQQLPQGYRNVFNLYIIEGYSHKEIGKILGVSENTSKSQLAMARKSLQASLSKLTNERKRKS